MTRARTNADNVTADIAGITAGTGITGGGTSGTVTITNDMATTIAAKGDILAGTANDAYSALTVGANGTVLTAASGQATGLEWATVAAGANWSLLNSGGTALTGAATITVSGISAKDKILILIANAGSASIESEIAVRFNTDTGNNYQAFGTWFVVEGSYGQDIFRRYSNTSLNKITIAQMSTGNASQITGYLRIDGCNAAGVKAYQASGMASTEGGQSQRGFNVSGIYNSASTISSVSLNSSVGNFDEGTLYVYTSA